MLPQADMEKRAKCVQLAVRISEALRRGLDREVLRLQRLRPGMAVSRSDVARDCLHRCLKVGHNDP